MINLIRDRESWCSALEEAAHSDFYHTHDYHRISALEEESPVLIEYREGDKRILLPLLVRLIPGTDMKDATSVYGYAGPIGINLGGRFDNTRFRQELTELLKWNQIVTVFSRLNPFIPYQSEILRDMGRINTPGKIVYLDLTRGEDQHWSEYSRRLRTYINKSRREYSVERAGSKAQILEFIDMYHANMGRVGAKERYFFEEDYFCGLLRSPDFTTEVLLARRKQDGQYAGGALFVKRKKIVQYHLAGAREDTLNLNPIKLLIDEMRRDAMRQGYTYLNLGGGVGNQEDSLFHFKSSFSKDFLNFNLWNFVVDQKIYRDLVVATKGACEKLGQDCKDFFPCYRCELV